MQEAGWEHHVVACKPKLGTVLSIKCKSVSPARESEATGNDSSDKHPDEDAAVVKRTVSNSCESGQDRSHSCHDLHLSDINPVNNLDGIAECVW